MKKNQLIKIFVLGIAIASSCAAGATGGRHGKPDMAPDGCFVLKVRFKLETAFEPDGRVTLSGPVIAGPLAGATLILEVQPTDINPGVGGLAPDSSVAALAHGGYTLRNGDRLLIDVLNVTDFATNFAVGVQTITGGTGRFADASGALAGTGVLIDGVRHSSVKGNVCFSE
jgi:hypothetical protein